jgi:hypothetical protein
MHLFRASMRRTWWVRDEGLEEAEESQEPNFCPCRSRPMDAMMEAKTNTLIAVSAIAVA